MRKRFPLFFAVALLALPSPVHAQTKRKSSPRAANVQTGTLVSIDEAGATLTLKPRSGPDIAYRLTEKTHLLRGKRPAEISAFKPGETVVARFRKSSVGPASLYDLCDKASWEWISRLRRETTLVTIKEITEEGIRAAEGAEGAELDYRVTEKTQLSLHGRPATVSDLKAGDRVYVVPRLLPGGNVMAIAISDAVDSAARLKERTRFTVTGTVKTMDAAKKTISLHSAAGDDRDIALASDCIARAASKDVPLTALRPGQTVTVHLTRNEEGEQVANRITIQTKRAPKRSGAKLPPKKP